MLECFGERQIQLLGKRMCVCVCLNKSAAFLIEQVQTFWRARAGESGGEGKPEWDRGGGSLQQRSSVW